MERRDPGDARTTCPAGESRAADIRRPGGIASDGRSGLLPLSAARKLSERSERRFAGRKQRMKEPYREGVAPTLAPGHAWPYRKVGREALVRGCAGRVLSLVNRFLRVPTSSNVAEGNSRQAALRKACSPFVVRDPAHAQKLSARNPGDPASDSGIGIGVRPGNPLSRGRSQG